MTRANSPLIPGTLGVVIAISTFYGGWQVADAVFAAAAIYISAKGFRPPLWSIALALAIVPGLFFSENLLATTTTVVRCLTVPTVLLWAVRRPEWRAPSFAVGIAVGLVIQTVGMLAMIGHPRQSGLTVNASELGQVGLMLFLITPARGRMAVLAVFGTAVIALAAAATRVPIAGVALFALLTRQRTRVALAVIACSVAILIPSLQGVGDRFISPRNIGDAARLRLELVTPSATQTYGGSGYLNQECQPQGFSWHGYGAGSFGATTRCVRPHVSPIVAVYELGIFAVVPAALAAWAVVTRRLPWFLAVTLGAVWLFVDEPLALPFGHYTLAAVAAVWIPRKDRPRMRFAGLADSSAYWEAFKGVTGALRRRFSRG